MELKPRIDMHCHYLPPVYYEMLDRRDLRVLDGGMPVPAWTLEMQLENMEKLSVEYACLSISSPHLHMGDAAEAIETARACNEYGAELMRKYPEKIGIFASLPVPEIEASVEEIRFCAEKLQVKGFSMMTNLCGIYLGDPRLDPVMEELDRVGAVVSFHPTQPGAVPEGCCENLPLPCMEFFFDTTRAVVNLILKRIPQRYPNIRFLIPHAGAFLPVLADRLSGIPKIFPEMGEIDIDGSLAGFYYDLAGVVMPKQYGILRKITGLEHLVFGTDGTFSPLPMCMELAEDMDRELSDEEARMIYQDNPERLLHL